MRFADILRFAFGALYQQKVRTLLTTLGVILGTFVLVSSVSIGRGVRDKVMSLFQRNDQLRKIDIWPSYSSEGSDVPEKELQVKGTMDDAKRQRIRTALLRRWSMRNPRTAKAPLTRERLRMLAALDHVVSVVPQVDLPGRVIFDKHNEDVMTFALAPDSPRLQDRLVAGTGFQAADERSVVVSEFLLFQCGIVDDADVPSVLGKKVRLEYPEAGGRRPNMLLALLGLGAGGNLSREQQKVLEKAVQQLPAALDKMDLTPDERASLKQLLKPPPSRPSPRLDSVVAEEFTIAGVVRGPSKEDEEGGGFGRDYMSLYADVLLPVETAEDLAFRIPSLHKDGLPRATITVDNEENVEEVVEKIKEMGFDHFSLVEIAQRVKLNLLLISLATAFVAGVALVVAALGITNTMLMTVLERTHEIGVMKAVGARDIHIQLIFLVEGALIGMVGGLLGLLCGWLASFPLNAVARSIVEKQTHTRLEESLFVFPPWLMASIVGFAALVTTLAAVYPARRAARVNPVTALRHE